MNVEEFWNLVTKAHATSGGDMDLKCKILGGELRTLGLDEAASFDQHFYEFFHRAYSWKLWDAAYLINGGCSDDGFTDFRSTLISMGRQIFETALADPESLAEIDIGAGQPNYEGYQYVAPEIYEELAGKEILHFGDMPAEPSGVKVEEWELGKRFPKLAAKFGHKDSNLGWLKNRAESESTEDQVAKAVVELCLAKHIIPSCGLIPPYPVLVDVIRKGSLPDDSHSWARRDLKEPVYWKAVILFEKLPPQALVSRPDLQKVKIRIDLDAHGITTFEEWLASFARRGIV
jgi:Protein of unknown function (DUF4240)